MFKINQKREFTHTVTVMIPVDGGYDEETFKARFKLLSADEMAEYDLLDGDGLVTFLNDVVLSLSEITDDQGKELPYNDALRDQVFGMMNARMALRDTYIEALAKTKRGN